MTNKVRLTRRVTFSAGHRYWVLALSEKENRDVFGKWASPYNHGHNYILDVTTEGVPDEANGMVVNIKAIDDLLDEHVVSQFDGKSINDEVPHFRDTPSTLENLLLYIKDELHILPSQAQLTSIRLEEMPTLWANYEVQDHPPMTLTRSYEFAASHRLFNPRLSDEENEVLFGKCSNAAGHGHNYILEVTVAGQPDARTGMIADLEILDEEVNRRVVDRYDHKNLNEDLPEFKGRMTTSELVVQEIWKALDGNLPALLKRVRLQETARNIFEVSAE